jgi:CheY-like chemotaxis protein
MPELGGGEVLKDIKKIYPKTHVIMITGNHFVNREQLLENKASEVLYKPFDLPKIMQTIEKINRQ